jgi:hypothetical protein
LTEEAATMFHFVELEAASKEEERHIVQGIVNDILAKDLFF